MGGAAGRGGGGVGGDGENAAAAAAVTAAGVEAGAEAGRAGEGEPAARKRFRGLLADRFQHPFDLVRVYVAGGVGVGR